MPNSGGISILGMVVWALRFEYNVGELSRGSLYTLVRPIVSLFIKHVSVANSTSVANGASVIKTCVCCSPEPHSTSCIENG